MLIFCLTFCDAIFFGYLGGGVIIRCFGASALYGWAVLVDLLVIALLSLDCALRFGQIFRDDTPVPDGFLEWLVPKRWRQ